MVDTYERPFIEMGRAYGFPPFAIATRYAFRPAFIPTLTILGLDFAALLGNAFLVEKVFVWPGISRYGVEVIISKDLDAIVGTVLIIAAAFLIMNIIVDLARRLHQSPHPPCGETCMSALDTLPAKAGTEAAAPGTSSARTRSRWSASFIVAAIVFVAVFADFITPYPEHLGPIGDFARCRRRRAGNTCSAPTRSAAISSPASSTPTAWR